MSLNKSIKQELWKEHWGVAIQICYELQPITQNKKWISQNKKWISTSPYILIYELNLGIQPLNIVSKLIVHKTSRRRLGRHLYILCTFNFSSYFRGLRFLVVHSLVREKCPNTEFFSGSYFPVYGKVCIWTLFT